MEILSSIILFLAETIIGSSVAARCTDARNLRVVGALLLDDAEALGSGHAGEVRSAIVVVIVVTAGPARLAGQLAAITLGHAWLAFEGGGIDDPNLLVGGLRLVVF